MKVYTVGDSHCIPYQDSSLIAKVHWIGSVTMHRVGRDLLNFAYIPCDPAGFGFEIKSVPTDGIVIVSFGEIDIRNNIYKQIVEKNRNEDEIIETLVIKYKDALDFNAKIYPRLAVAAIVPPRRNYEADIFVKCGSDEDRLRFTIKMNKALKEMIEKTSYYYLEFYEIYKDNDGFLCDTLRDSSIHIKHSSEMDLAIQKMISHFRTS